MKSLIFSLALAAAGLGFVAASPAEAQGLPPRACSSCGTPACNCLFPASPAPNNNYYWPYFGYFFQGPRTLDSRANYGWFPDYTYPSRAFDSYYLPHAPR
jgi:hypothetical protein